MGAGWFDALGAGWFDATGAGWSDSSGGGGGGHVFAMRADRPMAEHPIVANVGAKWRDECWDVDLRSLLILPEFLSAHNAAGQNWKNAITLANPGPPTQAEIDELLMLAVTERPEALGEILNQHQNFQVCWLQLLNMSHASHPKTYLLMKYAARVGELVMVSLKDQIKRARPSQVCPTLYPPVAVPGHSSFPAGHSLISHLTSNCLAEVVPSAAASLKLLAERVAFNRVIAGLHYRSDIDGGKDAADMTFEFLQFCPTYTNLRDSAKMTEWY